LSSDKAAKVPHHAHHVPVNAVAAGFGEHTICFHHLDLSSDANQRFSFRADDGIE
jgi:hypothetical protein